MSRIQPLRAPLPPAVRQRMESLLPPAMAAPELFRTVARNEGLFVSPRRQRLARARPACSTAALLPRPLRELLILRTCVAARNDYEWQLHVTTIAAAMGLSDPQIDDTRSPRAGRVALGAGRRWRGDGAGRCAGAGRWTWATSCSPGCASTSTSRR